jgi:hypothetical protein
MDDLDRLLEAVERLNERAGEMHALAYARGLIGDINADAEAARNWERDKIEKELEQERLEEAAVRTKELRRSPTYVTKVLLPALA